MTFCEAIEAAKRGSTVGVCESRAAWRNGAFAWINADGRVITSIPVNDDTTGYDWELIAPKQYDFAEAYAMMKAGRWMRSLSVREVREAICRENGWWNRMGCAMAPTVMFTDSEIDGKWIEVTP